MGWLRHLFRKKKDKDPNEGFAVIEEKEAIDLDESDDNEGEEIERYDVPEPPKSTA